MTGAITSTLAILGALAGGLYGVCLMKGSMKGSASQGRTMDARQVLWLAILFALAFATYGAAIGCVLG